MPKRGLEFFTYEVSDRTLELRGTGAAKKLREFVAGNSIVLDLGCGIGAVAKRLAPHCKELYAVDVSEVYLRRAKRYLASSRNVIVLRVDGETLSCFQNDTFDFIYSWYVLVHLRKESVKNYLKEAHRILKQGGIFYFHLPNPDTVWPSYQFYSNEDVTELLNFSSLSLKSMVAGRDELTLIMCKTR